MMMMMMMMMMSAMFGVWFEKTTVIELQGGAKNGATLSHCKYFQIP